MNSQELNARLPYAMPEELDEIRRICSALQPTDLMVMIGAGPGVMLLAAREGGTDFPITVIDINSAWYAEKHLAATGLNQNVFYMTADSVWVGDQWLEENHIRFLIVDGDHSYEGVKADLDVWGRKADIIFCHDYYTDGTGLDPSPGVRPGVDEWLAGYNRLVHTRRVGSALVIEHA